MSDLLNKASLVMVPSGYKEDTVYSVVPTDGSGDLSFTRASNGTRVNSAGLVEDCPWNLIEQSENFNNAIWNTYGSSSITANDATAPNGTTTADRLNSSNNIYSGIYQSLGTLPTNVYTYSIYVKAGTNTYFYMLGQGSSSQYAFFNLSTGVVGNTSNIDSASIESVGNGWYRCQIQKTGNAVEMFVGSSNIQNYMPTASGTVYLWGAQVNIGSTAKPYFPTTDRLNVPRLTYQNGGGGCPSLLLEKQSTNLVVQSNDMTTWTNGGGTMTKNATTSPDGTNNALSFDNTTDCSTFVAASNGVYSWSLYIKQGTSAAAAIDMSDGSTGDAYASFTFSSKTFSTSSSGSWSNLSTSYIECGNGWFRITLTATKNAGSSIGHKIIATGSGYTYVYGAQLEASSYPTSYIPTTSSSATRVADACYKTGISSLIGQTAGVVFADFVYLGGVQAVAIELSNSASADDIINLYITSSAATQCYMFDGGSQVGFINSSHTFVKGNRYKIAIGYASNDLVLYINGTQIGTATPSSIPTTSEIYISRDKAASYLTDTKYNEVVIFPTRLTNTELASLTTI